MPGDTFYWPVNRSDRGSSAVGEEWSRVIAGGKSTSGCSSLSSLQPVSCQSIAVRIDMCFLHFRQFRMTQKAQLSLLCGSNTVLGKKVLGLTWILAVLNLQLQLLLSHLGNYCNGSLCFA